MHEEISIAGATMRWDAAERLFLATYAPLSRPRRDDARSMQAWMDARAGPDRPFDMIVDLEHADRTAIAWRFQWVSWFYANRKRLRVAIHHAEGIGPTIVNAFALSTRARIHTCRDEAEARAWLAAPAEPI